MTNYTLNHVIENAPPLSLVVGAVLYYLLSNRVMKLVLLPMVRDYRQAKARQRARAAEKATAIQLPPRRPSPRRAA